MSGAWTLPALLLALWLAPGPLAVGVVSSFCLALAPLPAWIFLKRQMALTLKEKQEAVEAAQQTGLLLETMRHRAERLRDDLTAADQQARMAHQLAILGQFVAGFLHEVNNPLAILTGRVEALLLERRDDEALCADLRSVLKEAQYVGKIAGTLLPALRQAKSDSAFEPALPAEAIREAVGSLSALAEAQGARLTLEPGEAPRANVPAHILEEVIRALVSNALQALEGTGRGAVCVRLRPGNPAGAAVGFEVEDDGPGVPREIEPHLFEPFVTRAAGRQRSGLGLFIVASLVQIYDGSIRYEPGDEGGARFIVEVPRARFTREQPYHWFVSALPENEGQGG